MSDRKSQRGQNLVEFTLVLMILVMIAIGALDLGRIFHTVITITNSSREGARYLTLHPDDTGTSFTGTKNAAVREAQGSMVNLTPSNVSVTYCRQMDLFEGCDSGFPVRVTVSYNFELISGLLFSGSVPLTRSTQMLVP
jgi:Flp pilus assembly protein TadG